MVKPRSIRDAIDDKVKAGYCPHSNVARRAGWQESLCTASGDKRGVRTGETPDSESGRCTIEEWKTCPLIKKEMI